MNPEENNPPEGDAPDPAAELATVQAQLTAAQNATASARAAEAAALAAMKDAIRAQHPGLPPAAIDGNNPAEVTESVTKAAAFAAHVLTANANHSTNGHVAAPAAPHVPTGSTPAPGVLNMTPLEKIRAGLASGN